MEMLFSIVMYVLFGFFGLLLLLFILAILFGKRIEKLWEYEADFRGADGREFGEFDFERSRIAKEEAEHSFKAKFKMRHESLAAGVRVQVYLDDALVMQGNVTEAGRIYLRNEAVVNEIDDPREGQVCRVIFGGREQFLRRSSPIEAPW